MTASLTDFPQASSSNGLQLEEVTHILDTARNPSLLVSYREAKILSGNLALSEMSGYTREELRRLPVEKLFPGVKSHLKDWEEQLKLKSQKGVKATLITRRNGVLNIKLRSRAIGNQARFILLEIISPHKGRKREDASHEAQLQLINIYTQPTLEMALETIVHTGCNLMEAEAAAIYELNANHPSLKQISAHDEKKILPPSISSSDFITHLRKPTLSPPYPANLPSLHKIALKNKSSYFVSAPLKDNEGIKGVFVAVGPSDPTSLEKMDYMLYARLLAAKAMRAMETISKIKELEEQVASHANTNLSEKLLNEHVPVGVIHLNPDLRIQKINPATEEILGYAESEILNHPFDDILIGTNRVSLHIREALQGITTHSLSNLALHHRDGNTVPVRIKIIPVMKSDQEIPLQILVFLQDMSQEVKFKTQTQHLERRALIGDLNAIFSHEIRNPINNITSGVQLLERLMPEDFEKQEIFQGILDDCDRLTNIVNTVLSYSSNQDFQMTSFNLSTFLKRILARWHPRLKRVGINLHLNLEPNLPNVYGDRYALGQVFTNLIENAVHALEKTNGGILALRMSATQKSHGESVIQVDVLDTGSGIPVSAREHIFEPFFTTKSSGTGLGLSITKQIITKHKGSISVSHLPEGTVFHITLPASV